MIAKVESACLAGLEARRVLVEVSLAKGLPGFSIVGLPDASVREAKDRVVAAIRNSGFEFPNKRVTVNLAPADLRKEGACFDLAIAVGILLAGEVIETKKWPRAYWLGELALDGAIRPVRGILALARGLEKPRLVLPQANARELSYIRGVQANAFSHLSEVADWLQQEADLPMAKTPISWQPGDSSFPINLSDIKGQAAAKRVLEIAAAGQHNIILAGCPGTGKSMLAQTLPSLLPEWTLEEALDASQIHSIAGLTPAEGLLPTRPFRSPHHLVSPAALVGGGDWPLPGEISLAHRGVLFMDELPEFRRDALESLRQPLEEGRVSIQRTRGRAEFPCEFLLVAAMNPCPCGYRGHPVRDCPCLPRRIQKYTGKISGPLMDRMDLQLELPVLQSLELIADNPGAETSETVRKRVIAARKIQRRRFPEKTPPRAVNGRMMPRELAQAAKLDDESRRLLKTAIDRLGLSGRSFDRIRRIARTIADLDGKEAVTAAHVAESLQYRVFDRPAASA